MREWLATELLKVVAHIPARQIFAKVPMALRNEWQANPEEDKELEAKLDSIVLDLESFPLLSTAGTRQSNQQPQGEQGSTTSTSRRFTHHAWTQKLPQENGDLSSDAIQRLKQMVSDQKMIEANERKKMQESYKQSQERIAAGKLQMESLERRLVISCEKVENVFNEISAVTSRLNSLEDGQEAMRQSIESMSLQIQQLTRLVERQHSKDGPT